MNKLYEMCNSSLGQVTNKIGVNFTTVFSEDMEVRRNQVNTLYFSIVESLLSREQLEDLHHIRNYVRSVDKTGDISTLLDNIMHTIYNGTKDKRCL